LKVELKIQKPRTNTFTIHINSISAYINGGECGAVLYFPKRLRKVVDWSWPG